MIFLRAISKEIINYIINNKRNKKMELTMINKIKNTYYKYVVIVTQKIINKFTYPESKIFDWPLLISNEILKNDN
jgi:disulfide oxidoreductase YuzD